jgi:hypothetical protein
MSVLEGIQQAAVDSSVDLATLLRKCKLMSARLGSRPLEEWVIHESNGYPDDVQVPEYRIWPLELKGHFSGPFGSGMRNAPIPRAVLPPKAKKAYERYECRLSVANVEVSLAQADGMIRLSTGDLALVLGMNVYENKNCIQAWAEFSSNSLVELLNSVRNRILDFAIALWKESPDAGATNQSIASQLPAERITQIFNTTVFGGSANLVGQAVASTISFSVSQNDWPSLKRLLTEQGVDGAELRKLRSALDADPAPTGKAFGPRVSGWIARMTEKAANGTWQIGLGAAGNLLAEAIGKFYGL